MRLSRITPLVTGVLAAAMVVFAVPVDAGASVVVTQQAELSGAAPGDLLGFNSAIQGNTLVVGDAYHNGGAGVVYVYSKIHSSWLKQATLTGSDTVAGDNFGSAVALSGSTLVIGAEGNNGAVGAVYVFTGAGKSWSQKQKLTVAPSGNYGQFGWSVAISGNTIVAGAVNVSGAAFVFNKTGSGPWKLRKQLGANDQVNGDGFGYNVAITGSTIFVASPYHAAKAGVVYVFTGSGSSWLQRAELKGKDTAAGDNFGIGELSVSGKSVMIGAPLHASGRGAAYVFTGKDSSWKQQSELRGKDSVANDHFGFGGSIVGALIVVCSTKHAGTGAGYVFTKTGSAWKQRAEFKGKDTVAGDGFGRWVALAASGSAASAAVGAPLHASNTGRIYIFKV